MNVHQTNWARDHDWFYDCQCVGVDDEGFPAYEVIVIERTIRPGAAKGSRVVTERQLAFYDLASLKAWAGY